MLSLKLLKRPISQTISALRALAFTSDELKLIEEQVRARNAFKLFKLEERLRIDERKLKREMHKLQRAFHPDKIASSGLAQTDRTNDLSTVVNQSYQTLKDPYKRAKYLLEIKLNKTPDDIETALDGLKLDAEFLARMMEIREQIQFAENFALMDLAKQIESELDATIARIDKEFHDENYTSVLESLGKLQFLANCRTSLRDRLGDV